VSSAGRAGGMPCRWSGRHARAMPSGPRGRRGLGHEGCGPAGSAPLLRLSQGGQSLASFSVAPGWRRYQLLLPPTSLDGPAPLDLNTTTTIAPDGRSLGVALDRLLVKPPAPTTLWPVALRHALLLP